jgi:hypothetical protein
MDLARVFNGHKYMWDKATYEEKKSADEAVKKYRDEDFEVEAIHEEGKYYVFTRRVVTDVVVEGQPN